MKVPLWKMLSLSAKWSFHRYPGHYAKRRWPHCVTKAVEDRSKHCSSFSFCSKVTKFLTIHMEVPLWHQWKRISAGLHQKILPCRHVIAGYRVVHWCHVMMTVDGWKGIQQQAFRGDVESFSHGMSKPVFLPMFHCRIFQVEDLRFHSARCLKTFQNV